MRKPGRGIALGRENPYNALRNDWGAPGGDLRLMLDDKGLARIFRAESGRILAALMMCIRNIPLAEDALSDALL
jgi:hypothetical protein